MSQASIRYAKALLQALGTQGELDRLLPRIEAIAALDASVVGMLSDHRIPRATREKALTAALGNPAGSSVFGRLVPLLSAHRRMGEISEIFRHLLREVERRRGLVRGTVEVSHPVSQEWVRKLAADLSRDGTQVELQVEVVPALIGGYRVRLEDRIIDASVKSELIRIQKSLQAA